MATRTEGRSLSEYLSTRQRKGKNCWHNDIDPAIIEQVNANVGGQDRKSVV